MRPPHYAGENSQAPLRTLAAGRGFNEAPALRGGEPAAIHFQRCDHFASMRPPHYAGENAAALMRPILGDKGFNEAPALRGGERELAELTKWARNELQ